MSFELCAVWHLRVNISCVSFIPLFTSSCRSNGRFVLHLRVRLQISHVIRVKVRFFPVVPLTAIMTSSTINGKNHISYRLELYDLRQVTYLWFIALSCWHAPRHNNQVPRTYRAEYQVLLMVLNLYIGLSNECWSYGRQCPAVQTTRGDHRWRQHLLLNCSPQQMLMVAYNSVAYGSLLRIVAYEMLLFHVLNIIENKKWKMKNEKWKMKDVDSAFLLHDGS